jgi:hypothetical protein
MKIFRWIVAVGVSAAGLWFALHGADWALVRESLGRLSSPLWLALVPLGLGTEYTLRTVRWKLLMDPVKRASFRTLFPITGAAFFVNNVLPFRAGEVARVFWTSQKTGLPFATGVAILAVDRLVDMASFLLIILVVLCRKADLFPSLRPVAAFAGLTAAMILGLFVMAHFPAAFKRWTERPWLPGAVRARLHQFIDGAVALQNAGTAAAALGISLVFWVQFIVVVRFISRAFGLPLSWLDAAWLEIGFCFGVLLPAAPGYVGTVEAAGVAALAALGYDRNVALPVVLVIHASQILSTALWGVPSLFIAGLKWRRPTEGAAA